MVRTSVFHRTAGLALALAGWAAGSALAAWQAPMPEGMDMRVAVPRMAAPPKIDGTIDPEEWRGAAGFSGVGGCNSNLLFARPTVFWMGWNPDGIYVAAKVWIRPGYKPQAAGRQPGAAIVFDDTLEFHWLPMGRNVPDGRTTSSYKWLINALGFDGDKMRVSVGQQFMNWAPDFDIASRLTDTGTAPLGGRWLEFEFATTWQDFELNAPHRAGDTWKMMLGSNHMYASWDQARIPCTTSYFDPDGYAVFTLVEDQPAVQLVMDDYPMPNEGTLKARWRIHNPTAKPVEIDLLARVSAMPVKATVEGEEAARVERTVTVAPGATETLPVSAAYADAVTQQGGLLFQAQRDGELLYRHFTFFRPGFPEVSRQPAEPPKEAFPIAVDFNPARNVVALTFDSYYLDDPGAAREVSWRIAGADGGALAEGTLSDPVHYFFRTRAGLGDLAPGEYTAEARMKLADGSTLGPERKTFTKLDEAKAFADWWNTELGDIERVIPPFTAIGREGSTFTPWGRSYTLDALGLPREIARRASRVSAAPARVVAVVEGEEHVIPVAPEPELTETTDWRVRFRGEAAGAGLALRAEGWLEQDGMVQVALTYGPAGEPVTVDALRLEFPLSNEQGETLLCLGTGGNYASRTTIILPPEEQGTLWNTLLSPGGNGAQMTVGNFYPLVWVGNEQRGLMWYADSDEGWVPTDAVPSHELRREGGMLVLSNQLVGEPFLLDAPRTVTFTYMASPFRPMAKNWRSSIYSENGTFSGPNKKQKDADGNVLVDGWNWLTPPSENPEEWSAMWARYKKIADARIRKLRWHDPATARNKYGSTVHTSLPLMGYGWKSPDKRVTGYFAADWVTGRDSWNKTEQDYFLYIADRAFREGGLRTIYWDIYHLHQHKAPLAGLGYELPDGRVQPAYNALNIRRFMMRMWALMFDRGLTPGAQVTHATNDYCLPGSGWVEAMLDGEYHSLGDDSIVDWVDGYPIDRMRAMSVSGQFGNQITWMGLIQMSDKERAKRVWQSKTRYTRLYDTWRGWGALWMPPFDWGLNEMDYHPFWRAPAVSVSDTNVLVSAWTSPKRAVLVWFNYDRANPRGAAVKLDLDALGLTVDTPWPGALAVRTMDGGEVALDPATGTLTLPATAAHQGGTLGLRAVEKAHHDRLLAALRRAAAPLGPDAAPQEVPAEVLDYGFADAAVDVLPAGGAVRCATPGVSVNAIRLPDRVLIALANTGAQPANAAVDVDLDALGLVPEEVWVEFVRERDFGPGNGKAKLDFHGRRLAVPGVQPGQLRLVAVRRF